MRSIGTVARLVAAAMIGALPLAASPAGAAGNVVVQYNAAADLEVVDAPGNATNLRVTGHDARFTVESSTPVSAGRDCQTYRTANAKRPFGARCDYRPRPGDTPGNTAWQALVLAGDRDDRVLFEVARGGIVAGQQGNDAIDVYGGLTLNVVALGDWVGDNAGDGNDVVRSPLRSANLQGGGGDDTIEGSDGPDALVGNGGNDTIRARAGADVIDSRDGRVDRLVNCGNDRANDAVAFDPSDVMRDCTDADLFA